MRRHTLTLIVGVIAAAIGGWTIAPEAQQTARPTAPFTEAQAGTFGYILGPLNRTVGLGTARQTQISVRYSF